MTTPPSEDSACRLIERLSHYLKPGQAVLAHYMHWVQSEEEVHPGISALVRVVALRSLESEDLRFTRSAIQALACTGIAEDIAILRSTSDRGDPMLSSDLGMAIAHLEQRTRSVDELLAEVHSAETFFVFARALAAERNRAEAIEAMDPAAHQVDGALGWKNADIASFILAGLSAFEDLDDSAPPSWATVADFLYRGKIVE